jgi:hypothetical protein
MPRLVAVSGIHLAQKEADMSEEERFESEEENDDVEAHRRRALADEPAEQPDEESDDVEAHRRRA